jgi:N-acyl-D-aspartate/D-glutamate deacylase
MEFDTIVSGGTVVDGSGGPAARNDVGIVGGRITAVGDLSAATTGARIDATGLAVAPGFIDAHAHSDLAPLLAARDANLVLAPLRQGVTTEVCGNCGESPFPRTDPHGPEVDRGIDALFATGSGALPGFAAYAELLETLSESRAGALGGAAGTGLATNLAPLLGHGTLRGAAMGFADRAPTGDERALMSRLATTAFEQGAFGFSTGLIYAPGLYAQTDEIAEIARVAARFGAPYVTHMRDEADHVDDSIREALTIGERSGCGIQISHHKLAGPANWGRSSETLAMLDRARAAGRDVSVDVYPYTAGSTLLHALLPPWVNDGGLEDMLVRAADGTVRDRIAADFRTGLPGWQDLAGAAGWDKLVIAGSSGLPELEGRSIAELAESSGRTPVQEMCDLIGVDRGRTVVILHMMSADDVGAIGSWEGAMLGSDGIPVPGKATSTDRRDLRPRPAAARRRAPMGRTVRSGAPDDVDAGTALPDTRPRSNPGRRGRRPRGVRPRIGRRRSHLHRPAAATDRHPRRPRGRSCGDPRRAPHRRLPRAGAPGAVSPGPVGSVADGSMVC